MRSRRWPPATRRSATRTSPRRDCCRRASSRSAEPRATPSTSTPSSSTFERSESRARTATAVVVAIQSWLARGGIDQARALEADLASLVDDDGAVIYADLLPTALRAVLDVGDEQLAQRLVALVRPSTVLAGLGLASSRAQLAEAAGDLPGAVERYREAADGWQAFGNVPEQAYARLGQGRCLVALGEPGAGEPLRQARDSFTAMGYAPALAATEALLGAPVD